MKSIVSSGRTATLALTLICGMSLLGPAACASKSGTGPQASKSGNDAAPASPFAINHEDWSTIGYRLDWIGFPFARGHTIPIVAARPVGNGFIVQDKSSETAMLDGLTGERRWGTNLANPLTKFVGIAADPSDAGRVLVSSESEGYILALGTGNLVGKTRYEKVVNTPPLMVDQLAIFGTSTGEVTGHRVAQNVKAWGFQTSGAIEASPVLMDNRELGVVSQSGEVIFLNSVGDVIGRNRILNPVAMNPVTDGTRLFIGGLDQSVWAFASNGALLWRFRTASQLSDQITVREGVVYCSIPDEGLVAIDAAGGKPVWTAKETFGTVIAFRNGRLVVRTATGVDLLDPVTGSRTHQINLPGVSSLVAEKMDDGVMYAIGPSGNVAKFIPKQ